MILRSPNTPAVHVRGLEKRYGDRTILRGVDLTIPPGETYALLGQNGAGKSTAIEILEGFRTPDRGEVRVLGQDPLGAPRSWKDRIGIVAQQTGDLGPYTPRELLRRFAALYSQPRTVDEVLDLVGLTEHAGRRANALSGGQRRRLDVALGVIGRPQLLFLDEPTTGFDPEARRQFWDMLRGLSDAGTAILLTTHYLDEAAHLAHRVGVLSGGTIVAEAPPHELGGPEARTPIVTWRDADGVAHRERTHRPAALVAELRARAQAADSGPDDGEPGEPREPGEPEELEVRRPSLEDVYLELISAHGDPTVSTAEGTRA